MTPDRFIAAAFREWAGAVGNEEVGYEASQWIESRAAELARESVGDGDELDEVLNQLDSWCKAYPEDMFPEPDDADLKWLHETKRGLCDRISASMGRHMVKHMQKMADAIRKELASRSAGGDVERDAARYRWLRANNIIRVFPVSSGMMSRGGTRILANTKDWLPGDFTYVIDGVTKDVDAAIDAALAGVSEGKE